MQHPADKQPLFCHEGEDTSLLAIAVNPFCCKSETLRNSAVTVSSKRCIAGHGITNRIVANMHHSARQHYPHCRKDASLGTATLTAVSRRCITRYGSTNRIVAKIHNSERQHYPHCHEDSSSAQHNLPYYREDASLSTISLAASSRRFITPNSSTNRFVVKMMHSAWQGCSVALGCGDVDLVGRQGGFLLIVPFRPPLAGPGVDGWRTWV